MRAAVVAFSVCSDRKNFPWHHLIYWILQGLRLIDMFFLVQYWPMFFLVRWYGESNSNLLIDIVDTWHFFCRLLSGLNLTLKLNLFQQINKKMLVNAGLLDTKDFECKWVASVIWNSSIARIERNWRIFFEFKIHSKNHKFISRENEKF